MTIFLLAITASLIGTAIAITFQSLEGINNDY
jgi:hypothetical protein